MKGLECVVELGEPLSLQAVRRPFDVANMEDDAGVLLGHPDQTEVEWVLLGGEEVDVGGAFKEGEGGGGLQHGVQLGHGHLTEQGRIASTCTGRGVQDVLGQYRVRTQDEDDLVTVEPLVPQSEVDGAEVAPKGNQGVLLATSANTRQTLKWQRGTINIQMVDSLVSLPFHGWNLRAGISHKSLPYSPPPSPPI